MDLIRPLGLAGIRCAVVARPGDVARYSRFTCAAVDWVDPWKQPEELIERLIHFGSRQAEPPVLYYEGDWDLLLVSRFRDRLRGAFRFVIPAPTLVEDLVDKARFEMLARRFNLPVPRAVQLSPQTTAPADVGLRFPIIVKPLTRQTETWRPIGGSAKALQLETQEQLRAFWPRLRGSGVSVLAQELVPGSERLIESYHAYIDEQGEVVGEFTGRKIRTLPPAYGYSTALETTVSEDVRDLGREFVARLELRGVVKFDFKRAPDGNLRLLEVNPRFNLWHHLGAKAGVNLPLLVYNDLVGLPRAATGQARAGVRWCYHRHDARAARASGMPFLRWLAWAGAAEAKSTVAWDDPMPLLRGSLGYLSRRLPRAIGGASRDSRVREQGA